MSEEAENKSIAVYAAAKVKDAPTDSQLLAFVSLLYAYDLGVGDTLDYAVTCKNCDHCSHHEKKCYCFRYPKQTEVDKHHSCGEWRSSSTVIPVDGNDRDKAVHETIQYCLSSEKDYWSFPTADKIEKIQAVVDEGIDSDDDDFEAVTAVMKWLSQISAALVKDAEETKEVLHG